MIKDGVKYKLVSDHLGSIRFVVNASSGTILQELEYSAFGEVLKDTNPGFQPFGYAGGIYDVDTKLVKFGARDYNSFTGRWMQKDPIRFGGGDENLYRYTANNTVNMIDPSGNYTLTQVFVGGVAVWVVLTTLNECSRDTEPVSSGGYICPDTVDEDTCKRLKENYIKNQQIRNGNR
jgi:RHS repeat-associated protein